MKAIIVDDEKHVREAIKLLVPWATFGITTILEAADGQEAISAINEMCPELIFTDMMMPVTGGKELLTWIQTHSPTSKTIVISGYDDYPLVRHTMQHGGFDYILKPIDPEQLTNTVGNAVTSWREEDAERKRKAMQNIEMNVIKPVYWDKVFSEFIMHPHTLQKHTSAMQQEFGVKLDELTECQVAVLAVDTLSQAIWRKFAANRELLFFTITNVCNEIVGQGRERFGVAFRSFNRENEIVLLLWQSLQVTPTHTAHIQHVLSTTLRDQCEIGLGGIKKFPLGVTDSYNEARCALRYRNLLEAEAGVHLFRKEQIVIGTEMGWGAHEEPIRLSVLSSQPKQIEAAVMQWMDTVHKQPTITQEQFDRWRQALRVLTSRWGKELVDSTEIELPEDVITLPIDNSGHFSIDLWQEQLTDALIRFSNQIAGYRHKGSHVVYDIAKYIEVNAHRDVSLQEISHHFFMSREYISRKFKQYFNENMTDYISRIRMERAKMLLLNPALRMTQIAEMVGYQDEKYFSKVFKKMYGVSPNEYRKQQA
ncbi:helix-turn-helix domain-containing protein [Paenibacillus sp. N1-5-1-14]|uniref:helix-turn-helix domain-containing protein n=1 Tax=Paenibacillus radicibacter TaxID=2972488 RepID=UPI002158EB40|nr:helix-turn-helix domain-containing protein [Paenibacillus radicibacter]MCR8645128.1 helix-turn-helix domain-containing protein [Paenibacillus radicibacter]